MDLVLTEPNHIYEISMYSELHWCLSTVICSCKWPHLFSEEEQKSNYCCPIGKKDMEHKFQSHPQKTTSQQIIPGAINYFSEKKVFWADEGLLLVSFENCNK